MHYLVFRLTHVIILEIFQNVFIYARMYFFFKISILVYNFVYFLYLINNLVEVVNTFSFHRIFVTNIFSRDLLEATIKFTYIITFMETFQKPTDHVTMYFVFQCSFLIPFTLGFTIVNIFNMTFQIVFTCILGMTYFTLKWFFTSMCT